MPSAAEQARWGAVDPRTLEALRVLRGGAPRRRRRPSKATADRNAHPWPTAIERRYVSMLRSRIGRLQAEVMQALDPLISLQLDALRLDADAGTLIKATNAVRVRVATAPQYEVGTDGVRALARQLDLFVGQKVDRVVGRVPTIPANLRQAQTAGDLDRWIKEQVARITTIDERYFDDVEALIRESIVKGARSKELRDLLLGKVPQDGRGLASAEYNARRIARDQLGSLNGKLTRARYAGAGIARYSWQTMEDEAVRSSHRELQGQIFDVGGKGAIGAGEFGQDIHPGDDIQCRCRMRPIFDDEE